MKQYKPVVLTNGGDLGKTTFTPPYPEPTAGRTIEDAMLKGLPSMFDVFEKSVSIKVTKTRTKLKTPAFDAFEHIKNRLPRKLKKGKSKEEIERLLSKDRLRIMVSLMKSF